MNFIEIAGRQIRYRTVEEMVKRVQALLVEINAKCDALDAQKRQLRAWERDIQRFLGRLGITKPQEANTNG